MSSQASRFTLGLDLWKSYPTCFDHWHAGCQDVTGRRVSEPSESTTPSLFRWCWCKKHEYTQTVDILRQGKASRINQVLHVFPADVLFVLICWKTKTPRTLNCIWTIQRALADTYLSDYSHSQLVSCADFFRFLVKDHETRRQLSLVPLVCFLHTFGPKIWRERAVLVHTRL